MVCIEIKLPLRREGGGDKEKDQNWRGIKRKTPLCTIFFYLEKSEIYAKMLTFVNSRGEYQGFCFNDSL